jgi:AI-2 transport protein TqsA
MAVERRAIGLRVLITGASLCVVVAGLRAAGPILVPVIFSAFLAVLAIPPIKWLQARKVPDWLAVTIVLFGVIGAFTLVSLLIGNSISTFGEKLPEYEARLVAVTSSWLAWLEANGVGVEVSTDTLFEYVDAGKIADLAGTLVASVGSVLSDFVFVLMTTGFIMAEAAGLPRKLQAALGDDAEVSRFGQIVEDIQEYLSIKTQISLVSGLLAWLLCVAVGVDYALLWGVLTFLLHYVPNLGAIIAAIPPTLLAFLLLGWERAAVVVIGYTAIMMVMGNIIEPKVMGKRLGLSSLVVFLSLVFWGWIWGPLGMFLSVPLTMVVKILLEYSDDMKWIAVLLGSGAEMEDRLDLERATPDHIAVGISDPAHERGTVDLSAELLGERPDRGGSDDPGRS